jgi:predicted transcriptional regulator YheO
MPNTPAPANRAFLLSRYAPIADGIAALFFPYAEAVIHDLHAGTIAHIANSLSKRSAGDASTPDETGDAADAADPGARVTGPYEKLNWDGRRMRSVSNVLLDDAGQPAGVLCINFNIAVFDEVRATLDLFIKGTGTVAPDDALFRDDWQDRINTFLHHWLRERQLGLNSLTREHRRALVEALYAEGAFRGRSSANYVAALLGMGRATVYKHLKEMKEAGG